jgi:hypothetical protein
MRVLTAIICKLTCKRVVDQLGVDRKMLRNWIKQAEIHRAPGLVML